MQRNNYNPNGLTRSTSQTSTNNNLQQNYQQQQQVRPSSANRYQSPNHFYNNSSTGNTPNSNNNNFPGSQQRIIYSSTSFNNNNQQQQLSYTGMMNNNNGQVQQFVTLDEFLALKRQMERERGAREDAISQLREQIYELKEARRREQLDAAYGTHGPFGVGAGSGIGSAGGAGSNVNVAPGSPGYHRSYYQSVIASVAPMDNSILGRLCRIESYQSSHLQKQLEDLEERVRTRIDDKSKNSTEASRADLKKLAEQLDALNAATNGLKHDVSGGRLAAIEQKIAEVATLSQKNSSQIEVVNTHRIHDEETKKNMQHDLQGLHDEIRALETSVDGRIESANSRTRGMLTSSVDEPYVANEIEKRVSKAQDDQKAYFQERLGFIETRIAEANAGAKESLKGVADRVDNHEHRLTALEQRCAQVETQVVAKSEDGLRALDEKLSAEIKNRSSEHSNILKDLKANMEAKFEDRMNCMRDELDTDYSTQIGQLSDRLDDLTAATSAQAAQQQALLRTLVTDADAGKEASARVIESMEHFIRENIRISSSSTSSSNENAAAVYSSCLEKITQARQDEGGVVVGDALKILYQFERGQIANLSQIREDLADLRTHIGLVGLGGVVAGNNNNNNRSSPNTNNSFSNNKQQHE